MSIKYFKSADSIRVGRVRRIPALILFYFIPFLSVSGRNYLQGPRITERFLEALKPDRVDRELGALEAKYKIFVNSAGWLEGTGKDESTLQNNQATLFLVQNEMGRAKEILEEVASRAPQFFPARFNLGKIYLLNRDHYHAMLEFEKACNLIPNYWKNYFFLGKTYELAGDHNSAIYHYRLAYLYNPYDLSSLVALGDLLIEKGRLSEAKKVFKYCLQQDDGYNDALLGMGKVAYHYRTFYDALIWFRSMDLTKPYKKELHYYYAESAFFNLMYRKAVDEYQLMLNFPQDAVFNRISVTRIRARLRQAQRLALEKGAVE